MNSFVDCLNEMALNRIRPKKINIFLKALIISFIMLLVFSLLFNLYIFIIDLSIDKKIYKYYDKDYYIV